MGRDCYGNVEAQLHKSWEWKESIRRLCDDLPIDTTGRLLWVVDSLFRRMQVDACTFLKIHDRTVRKLPGRISNLITRDKLG